MSKSKINAAEVWVSDKTPDADPLVILSVSIPQSMKDELEDLAKKKKREQRSISKEENNQKQESISVSSIVREAIVKFLKEQERLS